MIYKHQVVQHLKVTDMRSAKNAPIFLTNKGARTASLVSFYFYNMTNPDAFLKGTPPNFDLKGTDRET